MVWKRINAQDRENMVKQKKSDGKNKMCVGYFVKGRKIVKDRLEVEDDTKLKDIASKLIVILLYTHGILFSLFIKSKQRSTLSIVMI